MATKKKMLQAAAGAAGGGPLDITDVFSTYVYTGTSSTQAITNGIDLAGEGGLVWLKSRSNSYENWLYDTVRGNAGRLISNSAAAQGNTGANGITSFNSDGFGLGAPFTEINGSNSTYASWTFRKAPKFFDVVTYTGDGTTTKTVSHNLESTPAMIIFKRTDGTGNWISWHKDTPLSGYTQPFLRLNGDFPPTSLGEYGNSLVPTSTFIRTPVHSNAGNSSDSANVSGASYVAYLFAHNNGDGEFGPDGDQDIIKCGSFTCNSSGAGLVGPNLGFEPQWVLVKNVTNTASGGWWLFDSARGFNVDNGGTAYLLANSYVQEYSFSGSTMNLTNTGFEMPSNAFAPGQTFIYMAIRRGSLLPPESATDVFAVATRDSIAPAYNSGFPVDMAIRVNGKNGAHNTNISTRLTQKRLMLTDSSYLEQDGNEYMYDYMNGWNNNASNDTNSISWMWKRAPGYFDVVAYSGNSTGGNTVSHNLGVAPEMIWVKKRNASRSWKIYNSATGNGKAFEFDNAIAASSVAFWNNTNPTASAFTLGSSETVNGTGDTYIAYLFASLDGISKVGSYTGNGSSQTIDCGFTSGARFILIKRTDGSGDWCVWYTARGIVADEDARLELNTTDDENNNVDEIDPHASGFIVNNASGGQSAQINGNNDEYIFYAIA
jgi:hypothetical protein